MGTVANSEEPDEMQHHAAFHQTLHCLQRLKQSSWTEIHHSFENFTCNFLRYIMDSPILIVLICMGKSIRIQMGLTRIGAASDAPLRLLC